jgi:hypothetical protein
MTTTSWGAVSGSSYGITLAPERTETRPTAPRGLIVTQAVQTKDGWLGQIIVDKAIVWESLPHDEGEEAVAAANTRVVEVLRQLFQATNDAD